MIILASRLENITKCRAENSTHKHNDSSEKAHTSSKNLFALLVVLEVEHVAAFDRGFQREKVTKARSLNRRKLRHINSFADGVYIYLFLVNALTKLDLAKFVEYLHFFRVDLNVDFSAIVHDFEFDRSFRQFSIILNLRTFVGYITPAELTKIDIVLISRCKSVCGGILLSTNHLTVPKFNNSITVKINKVCFVSNKQYQMILCDCLEQIHNHYGIGFVKVTRRLIGKNDARIFNDCTGNCDSLLLTA